MMFRLFRFIPISLHFARVSMLIYFLCHAMLMIISCAAMMPLPLRYDTTAAMLPLHAAAAADDAAAIDAPC